MYRLLCRKFAEDSRMVYMCSLSFSLFDGGTNYILSHFPHTTALEDLAGYFLNRKVVDGGGSLAGSGHSSLNSAFLVVCFILGVHPTELV